MVSKLEIVIEGGDKASAPIRGVTSAVEGLGNAAQKGQEHVGGLTGFLERMGETAAGMLAAQYFERLASAITSGAAQAVSAIGEEQFMQQSYRAVLAENLEWQTKAVTVKVAATQKEKDAANDLARTQDIAFLKLQQQSQGLDKLTKEQGANSVAVQLARAELNKAASEYDQNALKLNAMTKAIETGTTASTEQTRQVMDWAAAYKAAGDPAAVMYDRMEQLGLLSPVMHDVALEVGRVGLMAGLTATKTEDFTQSWIRYGYVHRVTADEMAQTATALLRLKTSPETGISRAMMTLQNHGIMLADIMRTKLGLSLDQIVAKLKTTPAFADTVIGKITEYFNESAPTMDEEMNNLTVLLGKFGEYSGEIWKRAFGPLADTALPYLKGAVLKMSAFVTGPDLKAFGVTLAKNFETLMGNIKTGMSTGNWGDLATTIWGWTDTAAGWAGDKLGHIGTAIYDWIGAHLPDFGRWAGKAWEWAVNLGNEVGANLGPWWTAIRVWAGVNWPKFEGWADAAWGWVTEATGKVADHMIALSTDISLWVNSAAGQKAMGDAGHDIGFWIGDGIKKIFSDGSTADGVMQTASSGLLAAAERNLASFHAIGVVVETGIIGGLWEAFTGQTLAADTGQKISDFLELAGKLANPALLGAKVWGWWRDGFMQAAKDLPVNIAAVLGGSGSPTMNWLETIPSPEQLPGKAVGAAGGLLKLLTPAAGAAGLEENPVLGPERNPAENTPGGALADISGQTAPLLAFFNTDFPAAVLGFQAFWSTTGAPILGLLSASISNVTDHLNSITAPSLLGAWRATTGALDTGLVTVGLVAAFLRDKFTAGTTAAGQGLDAVAKGIAAIGAASSPAVTELDKLLAKAKELVDTLNPFIGHSPSPLERGIVGIVGQFKNFRDSFQMYVPKQDWAALAAPFSLVSWMTDSKHAPPGGLDYGPLHSRNAKNVLVHEMDKIGWAWSNLEGAQPILDAASAITTEAKAKWADVPGGQASHRAAGSEGENAKAARLAEQANYYAKLESNAPPSTVRRVYDSGGIVPGLPGSHVTATLEAGEEVLTAEEAQSGRNQDHWHLHIHTNAPLENIFADFNALVAMGRA